MEFELNIELIEDMAQELIEEGLERVGVFMENEVKIRAPRGKTSLLADSVYHVVEENISSNGIEAHCLIGSNVEYGAIQEFGGEITPQQAKALTVPLIEEAYGKTASDFANLFVIQHDGKAFLARKILDDKIEFVFLLSKKVTIPANPYLTPALSENLDKIVEVFVGDKK